MDTSSLLADLKLFITAALLFSIRIGAEADLIKVPCPHNGVGEQFKSRSWYSYRSTDAIEEGLGDLLFHQVSGGQPRPGQPVNDGRDIRVNPNSFELEIRPKNPRGSQFDHVYECKVSQGMTWSGYTKVNTDLPGEYRRGQAHCLIPEPAAKNSTTLVLWHRGLIDSPSRTLVYGWFSSGTVVKVADHRPGLDIDPWTNALTIKRMEKEDFDYFTCRILSLHAMAFSYTKAKAFTTQTFTCPAATATGEPGVVVWFKGFVSHSRMDGNIVFIFYPDGRKEETSLARFDMRVDRATFSLTIDVVLEDDGGFTCGIVESSKVKYSYMKPQSAGPPGIPVNIRTEDTTSRYTKLRWSFSWDGGFPPLTAHIQSHKDIGDASWTEGKSSKPRCDVQSRICEVTLSDLEPELTYNFRIRAKNAREKEEAGTAYSSFSETFNVITWPLPAVKLQTVEAQHNSLLVNWTYDDSGSYYGQPLSSRRVTVMIEYEKIEGNTYHRYPREGTIPLKTMGVLLEDVNVSDNYTIKLNVYEAPYTDPSMFCEGIYIGGKVASSTAPQLSQPRIRLPWEMFLPVVCCSFAVLIVLVLAVFTGCQCQFSRKSQKVFQRSPIKFSMIESLYESNNGWNSAHIT